MKWCWLLPASSVLTVTRAGSPPRLPDPHQQLRSLSPGLRSTWQSEIESCLLTELRASILAHADGTHPSTPSSLSSAPPSRPRRRPFVTLTWAQSLDGCIAAADGSPVALSGARSLLMTHGLRAVHDAVLVVSGDRVWLGATSPPPSHPNPPV